MYVTQQFLWWLILAPSVAILLLIAILAFLGFKIRHLKKMAFVDDLTGLLKRIVFMDELGKSMGLLPPASGHDYKRKPGLNNLAILFIDFDCFKELNNLYGHLGGDDILKAVAEIIRNALRKHDFVCRCGGDEIVVALPNSNTEEARIWAEKICSEVENHFLRHEKKVTLSVGVASCSKQMDGAELIERADNALSTAKEEGRNQVVVFEG